MDSSGMVHTPIGRCRAMPAFVRQVEGVHHRHPRLLHGGRGQGQAADHVTGGIDVWHVRLEPIVDLELAVLVEPDTGPVECEPLRVAATAERDQHRLGLEPPPALEDHGEHVAPVDLGGVLRHQELDPDRCHRLLEHGGDLGIGEWQEPVARADDADMVQAEDLEQAGILAPDRPTTDDRQRPWEPGHVEDVGLTEARRASPEPPRALGCAGVFPRWAAIWGTRAPFISGRDASEMARSNL
jgi:hypothetical protein